MVISFANQKGGVGKTLLTVMLSDYMKKYKNLSVLVIDLDSQANASYSLIKDNNLLGNSFELFNDVYTCNAEIKKEIYIFKATDDLFSVEKMNDDNAKIFKKNINSLNNYFDLIIVDTAPAFGFRLTSALSTSDYVLCPIDLDVYSLIGIEKMLLNIKGVQRNINPKLKLIGMVVSKFDSRKPYERQSLESFKNRFGQYIIPVVINLRSGYAESINTNTHLWSIKKSAAKEAHKEMLEFTNFIYKYTQGA